MNQLQTTPREAHPTMLARMRDEMDRVMDRFVREPLDVLWPSNVGSWMPALDMTDTESEVMIKAEVPGMSAKDVDVAVSENTLTISGQKDELHEEKGENTYVSERRFGSFRRSLELPAGVDPEKVTAEHENGVITIRIPKLKTAKPKHIPVKTIAKSGV